MKKRLDELLVEQGVYPTRSQASRAIKAGEVLVNNIVAKKPGYLIGEKDAVKSIVNESYVGRGALKLKAAAEAFKINFSDKIMADIGASTGGFTDYALKNGASKIYAIDVGHDQLAEKLREDSRVVSMEGVNIREGADLPERVDLAVVDLSFISLKLCLEEVFKLVRPGGQVVCLFKPQFEAGKGRVNRQGVVRLEKDRLKLLEGFLSWCKEAGYVCKQWVESPVIGQKGNREYLILFSI